MPPGSPGRVGTEAMAEPSQQELGGGGQGWRKTGLQMHLGSDWCKWQQGVRSRREGMLEEVPSSCGTGRMYAVPTTQPRRKVCPPWLCRPVSKGRSELASGSIGVRMESKALGDGTGGTEAGGGYEGGTDWPVLSRPLQPCPQSWPRR